MCNELESMWVVTSLGASANLPDSVGSSIPQTPSPEAKVARKARVRSRLCHERASMEELDPEGQYPKTALILRARQITFQGIGINSYQLVRDDGADLPPFTAGAHIDLYFRDGRVRQYSLCSDPTERHHYTIAVLKDVNGRGGSIAIHERVHVQRSVAVGYPRNNFELVDGAKRYLLLAGGIGVTPLKAMVHHLERIGADYTLHYCAKAPEYAAFREEFAALMVKGRVIMHFDGGKPANGLNIATLLQEYEAGTHLYYCGPPGFMSACSRACEHWPKENVRSEHFSVEAAPKSVMSQREISETGDDALALGFQVRIASTGKVLTVANDKSIVQVLAEHGIDIATSCISGLCGSCKVRYLAGEVEHRDFVLSDNERNDYLTACISRAKSHMLVLDL